MPNPGLAVKSGVPEQISRKEVRRLDLVLRGYDERFSTALSSPFRRGRSGLRKR